SRGAVRDAQHADERGRAVRVLAADVRARRRARAKAARDDRSGRQRRAEPPVRSLRLRVWRRPLHRRPKGARAHAPELLGDAVPPIPDEMPAVASRIGIDLQPVDVGDVDAIAWLRACIWPEHGARLELFERAVEVARGDPPEIVRGEILETLPRHISAVPEGTPVCVFNTATLAYMNGDERERFGAL